MTFQIGAWVPLQDVREALGNGCMQFVEGGHQTGKTARHTIGTSTSTWYTELEEFIVKKYGSIPASDEIHHYETVEIKDEEGNLLVPGRGTPTPERGGLAQNGLVVSEDYTFTHRTTPTSNVFVTKSGVDARIGITNRQYEYDVNENKSQITTLQKRFIGDYVREYKKYTNNIKSMKGVLDVGDLT